MIDKEYVLEFEDGKKAKILDINDVDTKKIINELSEQLIQKQKKIDELEEIEKEHQKQMGEIEAKLIYYENKED